MKPTADKWRHRLVGGAVGLLIGLALWGREMFEPTDPPQYVQVQVVAYHTGARGSQWFTVVAPSSGQSWQVGAARGPFEYTYRGPALLDLRRGRWTGKSHLRLLRGPAAASTPNQTMKLTATAVRLGDAFLNASFLLSPTSHGYSGRSLSYFR